MPRGGCAWSSAERSCRRTPHRLGPRLCWLLCHPHPPPHSRSPARVRQMRGLGAGARGARCRTLGSAQHCLAPNRRPSRQGPCATLGDTAPRRGRAEASGAVHTPSAALAARAGQLCSQTHGIVPRAPGALRSEALAHTHGSSGSRHRGPCARRRLRPAPLHRHALRGHPLHPLRVPGLHRRVHPELKSLWGEAAAGPLPSPWPDPQKPTPKLLRARPHVP